MENITDWTRITMESLLAMGQTLMVQIPKIIGAIIILLLGWLIAKLVYVAISKALKAMKFDKIAENINMAEIFAKANLKITPSQLVGKFVYWVILLLFFVIASDTLGWTVVSNSISDLISYLPKLFSAIVIFLIGLYIANFIRKALNSVFDTLSVESGRTISSIAFYIILIIISLTALNQAGVDTFAITSNINLIIGGVILAFAIAFGFGAKDILSNILSTFYSKNTFRVGQTIRFGKI